MSGKNNSGEKPAENGLGLNNDAPPVGETAGTVTAGETQGGGEKEEKPDTGRKIGLARFLQNFPQNSGITALLRLKHKADVKTITEWEAIINELRHKKIQ